VIVDGTLGGGGHSEALLEAGATVLGVDRDPLALAAATARLERFGDRFRARQGEYARVGELVEGPVDGLLLDLGVSSPQLDEAGRGFSFQHEGPLDMRMSGEGELADLIYQLGEERFSRPIARELKARAPRTTQEAVAAVRAAVPRARWPRDTHVATRTFQALRIAVNRELEQLDQVLDALPGLLRVGGRAAIISFHSLEDRAVKTAFRALCGEAPDPTPRGLPAPPRPPPHFRALTRKAIVAGEAEAARNPRARSARLRGVEKVS
jgi:16S rRNA (cytosine1402-N4)-methyltransferase